MRNLHLVVIVNVVFIFALLLGSCSESEKPKPPQQGKAVLAQPAPPPTPHPTPTAPAAAASETPGSQVHADSAKVSPETALGSFREQSMLAMAKILGKAVNTRQEAINAAYFSTGWKPGEETTPAQDQRAYLQGLAWGFDIAELIAKGRREPLAPGDLAAHPLERRRWIGSGTSLASAGGKRPPSSRRKAPQTEKDSENLGMVIGASPEKQLGQEPTKESAINAGQVEKLQDEIEKLIKTVDLVSKQVDEMDQYIKTQPQQFAQKRGEFRSVVVNLESLLNKSEDMLGNTQKEIQSMIDKLHFVTGP
jgi:hypothetical protein